VLLCVLPLLVAAPSAAAAHKRHKHPPKTPHQLALELSRAKSQSARVNALHDIFRALGLGVRSSRLRVVVPGGEKSKSGIYLYNAEVALLADRIGAKDRVSFNQLAAALTGGGVGEGLDPSIASRYPIKPLLASDLEFAVQTAEHKSLGGKKAADRYGQLIYELGRLRHSDLSHVTPTNAEVIDPLQRFLITLGIVSLAKPEGFQPGEKPIESLTSRAMRYSPVHAATCTFEGSTNQAQAAVAAAKTWLGRTGAGAYIDMAFSGVDTFHAAVLAMSVTVTSESPSRVNGEFGTSGPDSAAVMEFKVLVFMHKKLPESVINCGALAGYTFPDYGGIPNVKVDFNLGSTAGFTRSAGYNLSYFGDTVCSGSGDCTAASTGEDGIATLKFRPDDEYLPGVGPKFLVNGAVSATALTLSSTGNSTGQSAEVIGVTKDVQIPWQVSWHQPRGYAIDVPNMTYTQSFGDGTSGTATFTYHGQEVCLGKQYELLPHPTEPPQNAIGGQGIPYEAFGTAGDPGPDYGYYTGTDTYFDGHSSTQSDLDSHGGPGIPLPVQGLNPGFQAPLNAPYAGPSSYVSGDVVWSGGNAQSQLAFNVVADPPVSPNTFNFTLPWHEATDCPIPQLPPPG
jgi:hypothetical protein